MTYKSIETMLVRIPTIRPHKMAVATMQTQTLVLVKITTHDGFTGWGEATTIGGLSYAEESPESIKTNIDTYFAPLLKTCVDLNIAQIMQRLKKIFKVTVLLSVRFKRHYLIFKRSVWVSH